MKKIVIFIVFIILITSAYGAVIGVSPSVVRFNRMLKNGYAEQKITVSTSSDVPLNGHFEVEGEIRDWISFPGNASQFVISVDHPHGFIIIIQPPDDTQTGNYSGILRVTTDSVAVVERGAGSSVIAQIALLLFVEVIVEEIIECRAGAISATSAEVNDPFTVKTTVYNDGNVRLRPQVLIDIYDQYQTKVVYSTRFLGEQILPTRNKEIMSEIQHSLDEGQYFADIYVEECDVSKTITFDIVGVGQIADSGTLTGIRTNEFSYVKEPMPIVPIFTNLGDRKVLAQFKGDIRNLDNDKLVHVLESDKLEVDPGATIEFKMFFTPDQVGEYQISGRVTYNNKITYDARSKVVNVIQGESQKSIWWLFVLIIYFIIGFLILIMIGKIRKARKRSR